MCVRLKTVKRFKGKECLISILILLRVINISLNMIFPDKYCIHEWHSMHGKRITVIAYIHCFSIMCVNISSMTYLKHSYNREGQDQGVNNELLTSIIILQ